MHPAPYQYETLSRWVERLAAAYEVSVPVFCRHALGLEPQEIERLRRDPPMSAVAALAAGTGIPVTRLQDMTPARVLARVQADLEEAMRREPEAFVSMGFASGNSDY